MAGERERIGIAQGFLDRLPFCAALRMEVLRADEGEAEIAMPWAPELVGDPATGVVHGGAVSALMDSCCGTAVMLHPGCGGATATLDLRIDYMRAAVPGQRIRARATCHHMTRAVAFVRAVALDDDEARPVATASGTFTVARREAQG